MSLHSEQKLMFLGLLEVGFYIVNRMELALVKLFTLPELANDSVGTFFSLESQLLNIYQHNTE